ncbi:MAG TPA: glycosyltransferase [Vicinamibacterales bacterium]|jgi:spore maturation protein CgeB|nr:glycosyltransferase [Vicinamibacterales bacterium]
MRIAIFGLSITSSWGNGHATTYRALVRALAARGHDIAFFERDAPWYADNRDLPEPPYCRTIIYESLADLRDLAAGELAECDLAIVGSYVPDGIEVGDFVQSRARALTAFYDIDTPVTLAKLAAGRIDYLSARQIPRYDMYLSFTGGPTLDLLQSTYGSPMARPLYCSVDPELYFPEDAPARWDLAYLGTYSADRQPVLNRLMLRAASRWREGRFVVAGPQYPDGIEWPANVERVMHLAPAEHRAFYNSTRFTLNVTRADMVKAGYSPSVRLFEAAACATPIISDDWKGLDRLFTPAAEILISTSARDTLAYLRDLGDGDRRAIGERARQRVLGAHTSRHRAIELETYAAEAGVTTAERAAAS